MYIPHKEVTFANDSAAIAPAEVPKLEASLTKIVEAVAKYQAVGPIKLFVVGHTDTVGTAKYNLALSLKRAQSIAAWFRTGAPDLPIAYEGFGEQALRVPTPDNTSEPRKPPRRLHPVRGRPRPPRQRLPANVEDAGAEMRWWVSLTFGGVALAVDRELTRYSWEDR